MIAPIELLITALFAATAALMAAVTLPAALAPLVIPRLRDPAPPSAARHTRAAATIILAARDEQAAIADTVTRALAQPAAARVIAVNDRSTDRTPEILDDLARHNPRLSVLHIERLPEGWMGKTHALHAALAHAPPATETPWILFIDADSRLETATLDAAICHAEYRHADHLVALPGYPATSTIGAAFASALYTIFLSRCVLNQLRFPRNGVGIGAFTLISQRALDAVGGLRTLRLEVVEDVKLGVLVKRARLKTAVVSAADRVTIDWQANAEALTSLLEKNFFAMARYSVPYAAALITANTLCYAAGILGIPTAILLHARSDDPLIHNPPAIAAAAAAIALSLKAIPALYLARLYHWPRAAALLTPLTAIAPAIALTHSMRTTLKQRGVRWRDHHYTLAELRKHQVW